MQNQIPQSLLDEFKSHRVILFVGSGLSVNAGLPLWRDLLNRLKDSLRLNRTEEAFFTGLDPPRQAQYMYDARGKPEVIQAIRDIFQRAERPSPPSPIHSTITTLPINTIVTSNWDQLLERQFAHDHISLDTIWRDTQLSTTTTRKTLIKMHGTIEDPDSIVFSEDDYYRFANTISKDAVCFLFLIMHAPRRQLLKLFSITSNNRCPLSQIRHTIGSRS
jgi:NAD-dependent SIR2 family protein deacetylase